MKPRLALVTTLLLAACGTPETGRQAAEFNARQAKEQKQRLQDATVRIEKKAPDVSSAYRDAPREIGGKLAILPAEGKEPDYGDVDQQSISKAVRATTGPVRITPQDHEIAEAEKRRKATIAAQRKQLGDATAQRLSAMKQKDAARAKAYRPSKAVATPLQKAPTGKPSAERRTARNGTVATPSPTATP